MSCLIPDIDCPVQYEYICANFPLIARCGPMPRFGALFLTIRIHYAFFGPPYLRFAYTAQTKNKFNICDPLLHQPLFSQEIMTKSGVAFVVFSSSCGCFSPYRHPALKYPLRYARGHTLQIQHYRTHQLSLRVSITARIATWSATTCPVADVAPPGGQTVESSIAVLCILDYSRNVVCLGCLSPLCVYAALIVE